MSLITIDKSNCSECGTCAKRCPACFTREANITAVRDDGKRCIGCGHCVALCPEDAIAHRGLPPGEISSQPCLDTFNASAFNDLIRHRRSHRHFLNRKVSDDTVRELVETCRYSPTGVNAQAVAIRVLRTEERIREVAGSAVAHFMKTIDELDREAARISASGGVISDKLKADIKRNSRYRKMGASFDRGWDPIFHKAPVVMIFHAPSDAPTPRDDCTIAAHTAVLHAELLGLGTCYIGLFTRAAAERPTIHEALRLPKGHRIFATIILGYPSLTFLKVPPRRPIDVSFE